MAAPDDNDPKSSKSGSGRSLAEELGRRAGKLAKAAKPRVQRLAAEATPRLQKTGQDAIKYARDHQDEIRGAAAKVARARVAGPLGLVVDVLAKASANSTDKAGAAPACASCGAVNPATARFCNQCGSPVAPPAQ